jgi:ribosome maturation factor RimP
VPRIGVQRRLTSISGDLLDIWSGSKDSKEYQQYSAKGVGAAHFIFFMTDSSGDKTGRKVAELVWSLVEPVVIRSGMELVDIAFFRGPSGMTLRLIVDKVGGVTIDDCADLSHLVGDILDVEDPIAGAYNLEVSSPGINRPLKRRRDFENFSGQQVFIETRQPIDGRRRFKGKLEGLREGVVLVSIQDTIIEIPYEQIAKARLNIL